MKLLLQNLQSGANISRGYLQMPLLFRKYFLPHSQKPIELLADYIKNENVDIATFTEADAGSFRTKNIDEIELISNRSGLTNKFFFPTTNFGKITNQGNAIASSYAILETKMYRLVGKGEPRFLCQAKLIIENINDKKIKKKNSKSKKTNNEMNIFVTHLTLNKKTRREQLLQIKKIFLETEGTKILLGDFNIKSEEELIILEDDDCKRISFIRTYPSWNPKKFLDNIFISKDIKRYSVSKTTIKMSDHLGLILEFN